MTPRVRRNVLLLVVSLLVGGVFAGSCTDTEFWDDYFILEKARALDAWWEAWSAHSLGLSESGNTNFWRPLVTWSYFAESRLWGVSARASHLLNVILHIANTWLAYFWLRRWLRRSVGTIPDWCCAGLAAFWAIVPLKAEAVGWISGRPDVLGPLFLLAGSELIARTQRASLQTSIALVATAAGLSCKESMVAAPLLLSLEATRHVRWRNWLRSPVAWSSGLLVAGYLAYRFLGIGIGSGGSIFLHGMSPVDRIALVFESLAHAVTALVFPFSTRILRGVLSFHREGNFEVAPVYGGLGLVSLLLGTVIWLRVPRVRPLLLMLIAPLLPVLNVVPTGLESRMSDRYLYLPSLGAWALVVVALRALPVPPARRGRLSLALLILAMAAATVTGSKRAWLFGHPNQLMAFELEHGERPVTLLDTAIFTAAEQGNWLEVRDHNMMASNRVIDLGLSGAESYAFAAARAQYEATGEQGAAAHRGFIQLVFCLLHPREVPGMPIARLPFIGGRQGGLALPCKDGHWLRFAAQNRTLLEATWLMLQARRGQPVAAQLPELHAQCPECIINHAELARAALALGEPSLAASMLPKSPRQAQLTRLLETASLQTIAQQHLDGPARVAALAFLGLAPATTCSTLRLDSEPNTEPLRQLSCTLAGMSPTPLFAPTASRALRLRARPLTRHAALRQTWSQLPAAP